MYVLFFFFLPFSTIFFSTRVIHKSQKNSVQISRFSSKIGTYSRKTIGSGIFFFFIDLRTCHALPLAKYTQNMPVIHLKSCQFSQWTCFEIRKTQRNSVSFFSISFWSWLDNEKAYVLCAHTLLEIQHIHIHTLGQYDVYTVRLYVYSITEDYPVHKKKSKFPR